MALAKGIARARHIPLIGILLWILWLNHNQFLLDFSAAILQLGRGRLAVGWFVPSDGRWKLNPPIQVTDVLNLSHQIHEPTMICGELTEEQQHILARKYKNVILTSPAHSIRRPSLLAELAWKRWQAGDIDDSATLSPTYLSIGEPIPG